MNKKEFNQAVNLAKNWPSGKKEFKDLSIFDGFALRDYKPVCCELEAMASLIRWQALFLIGQFDTDAINEIWQCRKKFIIADSE